MIFASVLRVIELHVLEGYLSPPLKLRLQKTVFLELDISKAKDQNTLLVESNFHFLVLKGGQNSPLMLVYIYYKAKIIKGLKICNKS